MMESMTSQGACFVTLTYDEEHNPNHNLNPYDLEKFLKRLRKTYHPNPIRFFAVGEYGDNTQRPHYHLILFGLNLSTNMKPVENCWRYGHVHFGEANRQSMSYCCGYITKDMTKRTDQRLNNRHPEFTRMSRRPGIGAAFVNNVCSAFRTVPGQIASESILSLHQIRIQGKIYPLTKYIHGKVVNALGVSKEQRSQYYTNSALSLRAPGIPRTEQIREEKARASQQSTLDKKGRHL